MGYGQQCPGWTEMLQGDGCPWLVLWRVNRALPVTGLSYWDLLAMRNAEKTGNVATEDEMMESLGAPEGF